MPTLQAHDLHRVYGSGDSRVEALRGVSLAVAGGEFLAVVGPSGCGKTTLLHLCGGMDRATAGTIAVDGVALGDLDDEALTGLRRERVGFVFQFFNLLPTLTLAALGVEIAGRLVRDEEGRLVDESTRHRRPLQLTARHLRRKMG